MNILIFFLFEDLKFPYEQSLINTKLAIDCIFFQVAGDFFLHDNKSIAILAGLILFPESENARYWKVSHIWLSMCSIIL